MYCKYREQDKTRQGSRSQRVQCREVSLYTQMCTHVYVHAYIHISDVHSITMTYVHVRIHKDECHLIEQTSTATETGAEHNDHTHTVVDSEWYLCMSKGREFSYKTHTLYKTMNNPCTGVDGETLDHAHINTVHIHTYILYIT